MWEPLRSHGTEIGPGVALGIAWGAVLWVVATGTIMPLWMGAMGLPAPEIVHLDPMSGVGHVVYGTVLGGVVASLNG